MTLLVPADHINMHFGYAAEGDPELAYTSLGFQLGAEVTTPEAVAAAENLNGAWQLSMKGMVSEHWAMTGTKVTMGGASPPYLQVDVSGTTTGENAAAALPNNCAVLVSKTSETLGRPGHGRMYLPGLDANSALVSGVFTPGVRQNWQDAIDEFASLALLIPDVVAPKLFHDSSSPVTGPSLIFSLIVRNQIATQRRRMRP